MLYSLCIFNDALKYFVTVNSLKFLNGTLLHVEHFIYDKGF